MVIVLVFGGLAEFDASLPDELLAGPLNKAIHVHEFMFPRGTACDEVESSKPPPNSPLSYSTATPLDGLLHVLHRSDERDRPLVRQGNEFSLDLV